MKMYRKKTKANTSIFVIQENQNDFEVLVLELLSVSCE